MKAQTHTEEIRQAQLSQQWEAYEKARKAHDEFYAQKKPKPGEYDSEEHYVKALNKWSMDWSCGSPNPPGYWRAAND